MEQVLVLFLLFTLGEDPALRERLQNFLKFYRENRGLIAMMTENKAPMSETTPSEPPQEEKKQPLGGAAGDTVFEELLNRLG